MGKKANKANRSKKHVAFKPTGVKSQEFKQDSNQVNKFIDRRYGENNQNISQEQKYLVRFQRERKNLSRKKNKFELDDDSGFTHNGVAIDQLHDDYLGNNEVIDSDYEEKPLKRQKMEDNLVEEEHFGEGTKSKQEIYSEIIANSKINKYERQKLKEANAQLTFGLNQQMGELQSILQFKQKQQRQADDYDELIGNLKLSSKRAASGKKSRLQELQEIIKELEGSGINYNVLDSYDAFRQALENSDDLCKYLGNLLIYYDTLLSPQNQEYNMRIAQYLLEYTIQDCDILQLMKKQLYDGYCSIVSKVCVQNEYTAKKSFQQIFTTELGSLSFNVIAISDIFLQITPQDGSNLHELLISFIAYVIMYSPIDTEEDGIKTLLIMCILFKRFIQPKNYYIPEFWRALQRLSQFYEGEQLKECTLQEMVSNQTWNNILYNAKNLLEQAHAQFKSFTAIKYLQKGMEFELGTVEIQEFQFKEDKIQEIETYEPLIQSKVSQKFSGKDPNKQRSETKMLKEQVKQTRKLARRTLHQESLTKARRNEELNQYRSQRIQQKRKYTRKILAEAESDFQKVMSSANSEKRLKKKRMRKGGNKM